MVFTTLFEFSGVTLRLGDKLLFENTCWTFAQDQNWVLIGPNGSGKTLLARALSGEVPVVQGEILYNFRPPEGKLPEDCIRLVSFEQQKAAAGDAPAAVRWFSVEQESAVPVGRFLSQEFVEEINPFEIRAHREQSPRAFKEHREGILDLMQIRSLLRRSIPSLSNGEMRKVLIARALLRRPRLLILDDAFAGLDGKYRIHLRHILERLMEKRTVAILLIDSILRELPRGISHMLYVEDCRIIAQGPFGAMRRNRRVKNLLFPGQQSYRRDHYSTSVRKPDDLAAELVKVENATVRYDGRNILSDINWIIRRGESWALIGPNGSGKSTLLSLISGDNPQAYANAVYLFGRRRGSGESVWQLKKRIGSISSELHLHFPDGQTCLETVISGFYETTGCFPRASSERRTMARQMLTRFGLSGHANSAFHSLSTGLQRMVLLARALVKKPDLLLLDEPCQGLDFEHRTLFLGMVEELLRKTDTTIVFVTHRRDEIPRGIRKILKLP